MDLDLKGAQEALEEVDRLHAKEVRDKKRLEKKVALLTEELHTVTLSSGTSAGTERLKIKNKGESRRRNEFGWFRYIL